MSKTGYSATTAGAVALTAATAKTILGIKGHANFGLDLVRVALAFDGVTSTAVPVLVEVCYCTWATNSPGTASTSVTPAQKYGRVTAVGATAGKTWTTEPTTLTPFDEFLYHPQSGKDAWVPLGMFPDSAVAEGFAIRCTAPAAVNVRATIDFERA